MKRVLLIMLFSTSFSGFSQEKVSWNVAYDTLANRVNFKASIAEGYHLYSQFIRNDIGPVPTTFVFEDAPKVKWTDKVNEPTPIHEYDENFEASLDFFKESVIFSRPLAKGSKGTVSGYVTYMVCNDVMCLPPVDYAFRITIP